MAYTDFERMVVEELKSKGNTVRVFQDGNYVVAHTDYNFFDPQGWF